jgi:hypothetical protein
MPESDDEALTITKPKKERSEKQKEHLVKLHLANVSATSKKAVKAGIVEHLNSGVKNNTIIESSDEEEEKPKPEPKAKAKAVSGGNIVTDHSPKAEPKAKKEPEPKPKKEPTIIYQDASSSDEEEVIIVKKKKKKTKKTIIYESESESEEEPKHKPKTRETKTQQNSKSGFTVHVEKPKANPYYFAD